jgi:hypothetical protein
MAERLKAAVLKTVDRKVRGFESLSLRHSIVGRGLFTRGEHVFADYVIKYRAPTVTLYRLKGALAPSRHVAAFRALRIG